MTPIEGPRVSSDKSKLASLFAALFLVTLLLKLPGLTLFPAASFVLAAIFSPVVISTMRESRVTWFLMWSTPVAAVSGLALAFTVPHQFGSKGDVAETVTIIAWLISIPLTVGLGVWSAKQLGIPRALQLVAFGGLVGAVLVESPLGWKGSVGIYATLFALAVLANKRLILIRAALVASAMLSAASDARFAALIALIVLICTFSGTRLSAWFKRRPLRATVAIGGGMALMAVAAVTAMQSGLLGSAIQQRTLHQLSGGRSLIEAGRTEWAASLHLFSVNPVGFGTGVQVHQGLASDAVAAVKAVGGDWSANYFRVSVFGERVDLHSIVADVWFHFGIGGVLFLAACAALLTLSMPRMGASVHGVGAAALFAVLVAAWDLPFSPMGNSDRLIAGLLAAAIFVLASSSPDTRKLLPPRGGPPFVDERPQIRSA